MRVGLITPSLHRPGGIQAYSKSVGGAITALGMELVKAEWRDGESKLSYARRTVQLCHGTDLLWCTHPDLSPLAVATAQGRKPVVVSTHGYETWGRLPLLTSAALRAADAITYVSGFTRDRLPERRVSNCFFLPPVIGDVVAALRRTPIGHPSRVGNFSVLCVGRLDASYKNFVTVVEALREEAGVELYIAGPGPVASELRSAVRRGITGQLYVDPPDDCMAQLWSAADLLCLPTLSIRHRKRWVGGEGFGIVMLEAAALGIPVVCSDSGACAETAGRLRNAMVVRGDNVREMGAAIRHLRDNEALRSHLARSGIDSFENSFTSRMFEARVHAVLESVVYG